MVNPVAIDVKDLKYSYPDGTSALDGVTLRIRWGESVCLAGPNGAGKSTLLLILAKLLDGQGHVEVAGYDPPEKLNFGLVFQDADDQLFCPTVREDVAFGPRNQKFSEEEVQRRVTEALAATGLNGFENRSAHHLSGGEKRRAAIAAVLACGPEVLALDEPWTNMDARGSKAVTEIISNFPGTRIVVSQDLYRASEVCTRMVIIDQGRVVADGPIEELLTDKKLLDKHGVEFGRRCRFCKVSGPL